MLEDEHSIVCLSFMTHWKIRLKYDHHRYFKFSVHTGQTKRGTDCPSEIRSTPDSSYLIHPLNNAMRFIWIRVGIHQIGRPINNFYFVINMEENSSEDTDWI